MGAMTKGTYRTLHVQVVKEVSAVINGVEMRYLTTRSDDSIGGELSVAVMKSGVKRCPIFDDTLLTVETREQGGNVIAWYNCITLRFKSHRLLHLHMEGEACCEREG